MKIVKISLAVAVIGLISFFVIQSLDGSPKIDKIPASGNPFTQKIEKEIISLGQQPENKFCNVKYDEVKYYIDDYYKNQLLGKNKYENNQWKEILYKNLYSVYSSKFIKQSYYVFNKTEWNIKSIAFIKSECIKLRKSEFLEKASPVDNSYSKIQVIISKYEEISNFITSSNRFSYSDYGLDSSFPISNVTGKILKAKAYKNNNLENVYVNNCSRLHILLNKIPEVLFNKHYNYLKTKFNLKTENNSRKEYKQYTTFNNYKMLFNTPSNTELGLMDKKIYNVNHFDSKYKELKQKLDDDSKKAYIKIP
jgi:hypothetical protein